MKELKLTNHINKRLAELGYDELAFEGGREWTVDCLTQDALDFEHSSLPDSNIEKLAKRFYTGYAREAMINAIDKLFFYIKENTVTIKEACVEPGLSSYESVVCNDFISKVNNELEKLASQLVSEGKTLLSIN